MHSLFSRAKSLRTNHHHHFPVAASVHIHTHTYTVFCRRRREEKTFSRERERERESFVLFLFARKSVRECSSSSGTLNSSENDAGRHHRVLKVRKKSNPVRERIRARRFLRVPLLLLSKKRVEEEKFGRKRAKKE